MYRSQANYAPGAIFYDLGAFGSHFGGSKNGFVSSVCDL